ncbi:arginase family protein [Amnibacterium kyonggiense]|uniref:Arginase n=1 Tax=Amnibacterium kyonggiense TaxID=595671 RepID=A0A4R7FGS0_9MICO|nr:arginase family protein [Amnibacterium kyonggiense]TDS75847.1 arginase [Amnibacterium kyonggiense]
MPARFVVVPQWQGSSSSRAMRLIDGAEAIRGDLPSSATTTVEVPLGAGDAVGTGVHRYSAVATVRERLRDALAAVPEGDLPVVVGGDCGVELAAVERAAESAAARGARLGLVWFDAHPDLNTPDSSPSGAFCGMVLRALLGEGADGLTASTPVDPRRVVLAGTRNMDDQEAEFVAASGIAVVAADAVAEGLGAAVDALDVDEVYLHVDLDVLDPGEFDGVTDPQPFGASVAAVTAGIAAASAGRRVIGAGLTMFAPASPDDVVADQGTILRVVSALTASTRTPR